VLWIIGYHNSNRSPMPKSPVFFSSTNVAPRPHWGWPFQQVMPKWKQSCANLASQWGTPSGTFGNWFWNGGSCWDVKNSIVHAEAHAHCSEDHAKMFLGKIFASWACRRAVYWDARIIYAPKLASPHHDPHNNRLHDDDNNNDSSTTNNNNHYHHCHRRHRHHHHHHHHHFNYTLFLLPLVFFLINTSPGVCAARPASSVKVPMNDEIVCAPSWPGVREPRMVPPYETWKWRVPAAQPGVLWVFIGWGNRLKKLPMLGVEQWKWWFN
jgi:hypothetical protein